MPRVLTRVKLIAPQHDERFRSSALMQRATFVFVNWRRDIDALPV
jgi:hypothetical protein